MDLRSRFLPVLPSSLVSRAKKRRYQRVVHALAISPPATILDVGCGRGVDFVQVASDEGFRCIGLDLVERELVSRFELTLGDAARLPFPDNHFDAVVSIGLFEHLQPIETLSDAACEIRRVARRFCVVVPAISTLIEPHTLVPLWQLRASRRGRHPALNYYADDVWKKFTGFRDAEVTRFSYLPGVRNLMIHGGR